MSDLRRRLAPIDSGFGQFIEAADYFGLGRPLRAGSLNRWCDLRYARSNDRTEPMDELLRNGAVSEADLRAVFGEAA